MRTLALAWLTRQGGNDSLVALHRSGVSGKGERIQNDRPVILLTNVVALDADLPGTPWERLEPRAALKMTHTLRERAEPLVKTRSTTAQPGPARPEPAEDPRGFGGGGSGKGDSRKAARRKGGKKKTSGLSKADWGPLGKHPDLDAIVARQRLHLPLSGRIREGEVNRAWKAAAAEHHPDRGGEHDTMQLVNGARDLLLGRGAS